MRSLLLLTLIFGTYQVSAATQTHQVNQEKQRKPSVVIPKLALAQVAIEPNTATAEALSSTRSASTTTTSSSPASMVATITPSLIKAAAASERTCRDEAVFILPGATTQRAEVVAAAALALTANATTESAYQGKSFHATASGSQSDRSERGLVDFWRHATGKHLTHCEWHSQESPDGFENEYPLKD